VTDNDRLFVLEKIGCAADVSDKLDAYAALLCEWQEKMNLVAKSTLPVLWTRHILDSAQLTAYLTADDKKIVDFGSGAGFPGLVLAVLNPEKQVHLIESDMKKAAFLSAVTEKLGLDNVTVHRDRIEKIIINQAHIITARALAPLETLLAYVLPYMGEQTRCLFMKGKKAEEEISVARKKFLFSLTTHPSITSEEGKILLISKAVKK